MVSIMETGISRYTEEQEKYIEEQEQSNTKAPSKEGVEEELEWLESSGEQEMINNMDRQVSLYMSQLETPQSPMTSSSADTDRRRPQN